MFYRKHKHKKHKNREPWKGSNRIMRGGLTKTEYKSFIINLMNDNCDAIVNRIY